MKKITALILLLATIFTFTACKNSEYKPIPSTEEESRVILSFEIEKEKYEVKYELYRALFLNMAQKYDAGNKDFWKTEAAKEAIPKINNEVFSLAADIFAAIHLSKKIGYDPYSSKTDKLIEEYIEKSINGDGESIEGFGSDYNLYLEHLKKFNLNYSVQVLLYRYAIAYDKVIEYYKGTVNEDNPTTDMQIGALSYTKDDVLNFYNSEESVRVSMIVMNSLYISKENAQKKRNAIAAEPDQESALIKAIGLTSGDANDILNGIVIGKNSLDPAYYGDVTNSAFALDIFETSNVIELSLETRSEYWILYKMQKTNEHFESDYENIESAFVSQKIGEILNEVKNDLLESLKTTDEFNALDYSSIEMK